MEEERTPAAPEPTEPGESPAKHCDAWDAHVEARVVAFWLFAASTLVSWIIGMRCLRHTVPAAKLSFFGWLHFPLAYLAHFASMHLIFFGLACLMLVRWRRRWIPLCIAAGGSAILVAALVYGVELGGLGTWLLGLVCMLPLILLCGVLGAWPGRWTVGAYYALISVPLQLIIYIDGVVFANYRTHFNGAILKMLLTPGVRDLFEFSTRDFLKVGSLVLLAVATCFGAAWGLSLLNRRSGWLHLRLKRYAVIAVLCVVGVALVEKGIYAASDLTSRRDVLVNARVIPFYMPTTCKRWARWFGMKVDRQQKFSSSLALKYPRKELNVPEGSGKYNVVWIAIEGWRADALTPEISPRLSAFGDKCLVADRHYSSGNCTRIGIFGMFYGLEGFYWHAFLADRQGPVLIRAMKKMNYEFLMMGAANFMNPEFRVSCFAELPDHQVVHGESLGEKSYDRDYTIAGRFKKFLGERDGSRPFFFFWFLDSTHSPYRWKEGVGFKPPFTGFDKSIRHERLADDDSERRRAFVRYKNSAAWVDFLIGRTLEELRKRDMLDKTIVMISGDHSEEFGENGYYGHAGNYGEYQLRTPLLFHYPGVQPGRFKKMTSHIDWAPTTLKLLGVDNPPEDYCQGLDLLGPGRRSYLVATGYSNGSLVADDGYRLVFPILGYRPSTIDVYDRDYREPPNREAVLRRHAPKLNQVLKASRRFKR